MGSEPLESRLSPPPSGGGDYHPLPGTPAPRPPPATLQFAYDNAPAPSHNQLP
eukprot:gene46179-10984_t